MRWLTVIVSVMLALAPSATAGGGSESEGPDVRRIDAADPTAAAIQISQLRFADDAAGWVVLSRDDGFADSLAGSALSFGGPLLFTRTTELTPATRAEIDRVLPPGDGTSTRVVYLLGGENAIAPAVAAAIDAAGYATIRLAGPSRVETAVAVADEVRSFNPNATAAVARAYAPDDNPTAAWADSVTGGAWAATSVTPILVTPSESLHPAVGDWLARDGTTETIVLGGTAALSEAVAAAVPNPRRVQGATRAETAGSIFTQLLDLNVDGARTLIVIDGYRSDGWAFGLAAGGLAADVGAALVVTLPGSDTPQITRQLATSCNPDNVDLYVLGSTAVVPDDIVSDLHARDGIPCEVPEGAFEFAFCLDEDGDQPQDCAATDDPGRWSPDAPIAWVVNPADMPYAEGLADLTEAFDRIAAETGLTFVYEGEVDEVPSRCRDPYQPDRYGERWAPILIKWLTDAENDGAIPEGAAASGHVYGRSHEGHIVIVSGYAAFRAGDDTPAGFDAPFDRGAHWGEVILHELGHVVGFAHTTFDDQIMRAPFNEDTPASYGYGDVEGLRLLGVATGPLAIPPPVSDRCS